MGIYDRDYYRAQPARGGFGHFVAWSVTTWLIAINVLVFFGDAALKRVDRTPESMSLDDNDSPASIAAARAEDAKPLTRWGSFSRNSAINHGQIWRFITFQFLHADPWHLLVNMLGLFFFGPIVEAHFGSRRYLAFYLICGLAGAACFAIMVFMHVLNIHPDTQLVGASAGIFGLLVASAIIAPDVQVFYYLMPITIRMIAIFGMLLAAYTVLNTGNNAGGEAAHLGGGVLGFILMKNQHWLNAFAPRAARSTTVRRRPRRIQKDWSKDLNR